MAISQCLKCGNRSFETIKKIPIGYPRKVMFLQCSVCGGIVGVQEGQVRTAKNNSQRFTQNQELPRPSMKTQTGVPDDVNTILKRLYG
jgi:ribosomal protein L37E